MTDRAVRGFTRKNYRDTYPDTGFGVGPIAHTGIPVVVLPASDYDAMVAEIERLTNELARLRAYTAGIPGGESL